MVGKSPVEETTPSTTQSSNSDSPLLELLVDPGQASDELLEEISVALSELNQALGGIGIEIQPADCDERGKP